MFWGRKTDTRTVEEVIELIDTRCDTKVDRLVTEVHDETTKH